MKRAKTIEYPMRHSKRKRYSCQECADVDDDDMVMCEICYKWSHYRCAGVGPEIEDLNFSCQNCKDIDKYINSTDSYVKAKATEKKIRDARKFPRNSENGMSGVYFIRFEQINYKSKNIIKLAKRELSESNRVQVIQEIIVEQSETDKEKMIAETEQLYIAQQDQHEETELVELAQQDEHEETESVEIAQAMSVEPVIEQLYIAQQDEHEETESVEIAQAISVEPEIEQLCTAQQDEHEEIESDAVSVESKLVPKQLPDSIPELALQVGSESKLKYKLPIEKKRHIKNFNRFLQPPEILHVQALEHSDHLTKDYKEMVRVVSKNIFSDKFLLDYSFCGQGKKELRKYTKVIELIVEATAIKFPDVPRPDILDYFKKEYVKYATRRYASENK